MFGPMSFSRGARMLAYKPCGAITVGGQATAGQEAGALAIWHWAIGIAMLVMGSLVSPNRPDPQKLAPYECGFEAFEDARMKFDVRYYLIAILFILFDLEIAFLFPWAVCCRTSAFSGSGR